MFSVEKDEWTDLDTDHPTRRIMSIANVVEVSACTFPAYDDTEIYARSKEALDNARSALDSARQQKADPVDTGIELAKAKFNFILKLGGMQNE